MKKILAVATLDFRRLGFGLVSVALIAGLVPSLAKGLGGDVPVEAILMGGIILVGIIAGGNFGNDFSEGKSSFFFARPLSTGELIAGRFLALIGLSAAAFASVMTAYWLSAGRSDFPISLPGRAWPQAMGVSWALSLFVSLTIAAHRTEKKSKWSLRDFVVIPLRLTLFLTAGFTVFGLFADLTMRAYAAQGPVKLFFGSFVASAFVTACLSMEAGRTDRLRITRFLNLGMSTYGAIAAVVVAAAWTYVLHPGPEAIEGVAYAQASADGRSAFVNATVDRGDPKRFHPIFVLDIASGQARHLNADSYRGPWTSADGGTTVWSEATPSLFRPLMRYFGGVTNLRVRTSSGEAQPLPLPSKLPYLFSELVERVIPAPDGDVFAIQWRRHLTLVSRTRGELSDLDLDADHTYLQAASFLPSGELRLAMAGPDFPVHRVDFVDLHPGSGRLKPLGSVEVGHLRRIAFDATGSRALVDAWQQGQRATTMNQRASISLIELSSPTGDVRSTVLIAQLVHPTAFFMADGRIAAMGTGLTHGPLRAFSRTGAPLLDVPVGEGEARLLTTEMFPGIVAVWRSATRLSATRELLLFDTASGALVRQLSVPSSPLSWVVQSATPPPPGSAAARLLYDRKDRGKLYELPSITAEPRLLLPAAKQ